MGHHANNHQQRKDENQCANDSADDGLYRRDAGGVLLPVFSFAYAKEAPKDGQCDLKRPGLFFWRGCLRVDRLRSHLMMFHHGTQDRHDTQAHQARPFLFMSGNCGYPGDAGNACSVCGRPGVVVIRVAVRSARLEANASGVTIVQSQQV